MFQGVDNFHLYPLRRNESRKMTDVPCFIVYLIITFILIGAFFYSFILEKERNLFTPEDPDGNRCGEGKAKGHPFVYFPAPFLGSLKKSVCVASCPTDENYQLDCLPNSLVKNCEYDITDHFNRINQFIIYETKKNQFLKLCQPASSVIFSSLNSKINTYSLLANFERVYQAKYVIMVVCPVICLTLIILYVVMIHCLKDIKYMVWITFILFLAACLFISIYLVTPAGSRLWSVFPVIGLIFMVMILGAAVFIFVDRERMNKSIELLNLATIYIKQNPLLILISLGSFIVWAFVFALELVVFLSIFAINEGQQSKGEKNGFAFFTSINNNGFVKFLLVLNVFHYIWTNLLIYHTSKYLTKGMASNWVLRMESPFKLAVYSMVRFHTGTVIYGSIVLPFLSWITDFLYFIMPTHNGKVCCCTCNCLVSFYQGDCFKRFLGFFTELTYIRVNLEGEQFCEAGEKLTPMLVENLVYINKAYRMATIFMFSSKILIAFFTTLICYAILEVDTILAGHIITNVIIFIFSLVLTGFATDSYDRSFETILITILINKEKKREIVEDGGLVPLAIFEGIQDPAKKEVYEKIHDWFESEKNEMENEEENERRANDSNQQ